MIRNPLRHIVVAVAAVAATGCAGPVVSTDDRSSQKQVSFPKVGATSTVRAGAVAALHVNPRSDRVFQLTQPLDMSVALVNKILVPADEPLFKSDMKGETLYCSSSKTYIDRLAGPWAIVCFKSTSPGKFSAVSYQPGAMWFSKPLEPEIDYVPWKSGMEGQGAPLKRELVYEGSRGGVLMFSERIYGKSLDTPSVIKPLMAQVPSLPGKASLDGLEVNVLRVEGDAMTFEVVQSWQ